MGRENLFLGRCWKLEAKTSFEQRDGQRQRHSFLQAWLIYTQDTTSKDLTLSRAVSDYLGSVRVHQRMFRLLALGGPSENEADLDLDAILRTQ